MNYRPLTLKLERDRLADALQEARILADRLRSVSSPGPTRVLYRLVVLAIESAISILHEIPPPKPGANPLRVQAEDALDVIDIE